MLVGFKSVFAFGRSAFVWLAVAANPRRRFRAYCTLLTLKKIIESLFERVPAPSSPLPITRPEDLEAALDVRGAP